MNTPATEVGNVKHPPADRPWIKIDRSTRWGNPHRISLTKTRDMVICEHWTTLISDLRKGKITWDDLTELEGRTLLCHCSPLPCHGDNLVLLLNKLKYLGATSQSQLLSAIEQLPTSPDTLLVFGSRSLDPVLPEISKTSTLENLITLGFVTLPKVVLHGGAKGGDALGNTIAEYFNVPVRIIRPQWHDENGIFDKAAGFKRNKQLVAGCTRAIGFWDGFSKGTVDTIKELLKAHIPCDVLVMSPVGKIDAAMQLWPDDSITFGAGEKKHGFLHNFSYNALVECDGMLVTTEHVYQSLKHPDGYKMLKKYGHQSPKDFKTHTQNLYYPLSVRKAFMKHALYLKHDSHPDLFKDLGDTTIVGLSNHDLLWGAYNSSVGYYGTNLLGELWQEVISSPPERFKIIKGDLFDLLPEDNWVLIHGVNAIGAWGKGFVVPLGEHFPEAKSDYLQWVNGHPAVGSLHITPIKDRGFVVHVVTQSNIRSSVNPTPFELEGLVNGLVRLKKLLARSPDIKIYMPMIGTGLGGGKWHQIEAVIRAVMRGFDITVVQY